MFLVYTITPTGAQSNVDYLFILNERITTLAVARWHRTFEVIRNPGARQIDITQFLIVPVEQKKLFCCHFNRSMQHMRYTGYSN